LIVEAGAWISAELALDEGDAWLPVVHLRKTLSTENHLSPIAVSGASAEEVAQQVVEILEEVVHLGAGAGAAGAAEVNSSAAPADVAVPSPSAQWQMSQAELAESEPFTGVHQAGILTSRQMQSTFAALDCFAPIATSSRTRCRH
jgi:hypothetical protein